MFAAQDIVGEVQNLVEELGAVLNRPGPIAPSSSYPPMSLSETIYNTMISVPGHIATTRITLHLTGN